MAESNFKPMPVRKDVPALGEASRQKQASNSGDWGEYLSNAAESTFSAVTREQLGYEPKPDIQRWRAKNPTLGGISEFAGTALPFLVPYTRAGRTVARALPGTGKVAKAGEEAIEQGQKGKGFALEEAGLMAGTEGLRTAGTAAAHGPFSEEVLEVAGEGAFNVALSTGVGGALGHLSNALPPVGRVTNFESQLQKADPSFDTNSPPQIKLSHMKKMQQKWDEAGEEPDEGFLADFDRHYEKLRREVRYADPPQGKKAVDKVVGLKAQEGDIAELASLFRVKNTKSMRVRKFASDRQQGGLGSRQEAREKLKEAGFPEGWEESAFYPRVVKIKSADKARRLQKNINKLGPSTQIAGRQAWIGREVDDGAYVVAKRMNDRQGPIVAGDELAAFKTDNPAVFAPEMSGFTSPLNEQAIRESLARRSKEAEGSLTQGYDALEESAPGVGIMAGQAKSPTGGAKTARDTARRWLEAVVGKERLAEIRHAASGTGDFLGGLAREYGAASSMRYAGANGSARAASTSLMSKAIKDLSELQATRVLAGKVKPSAKTSIIRSIFKQGEGRSEGVLNAVENMPNEAMPDFNKIFRENLSPGEAADRGLNADAVRLASILDETDQRVISDINAINRDLGYKELDSMENHYMLSRMFKGRLRLPVKDSQGAALAVASGRSSKEVLREADRLKQVIEESGRSVTYNKNSIRYADIGDDLEQVIEIGGRASAQQQQKWLRDARTPSRFDERKGVGGYQGELDDLTKKDIKDMLTQQVKGIYNLAAHRTVKTKLDPELQRLHNEDAQMARAVDKELQARFGQRGQFSQATEDAIDRILTPVLGTRASEITRKVNNAVFQLTLGMGNVAFSALNAATFMQTTLGEASFLLKAPPSAIRDMYSHAIIGGSKGASAVRYLEPLRIAQKAWKDIRQPSDELWQFYQRAKDEGRVSPVMAEEVMGRNSSLAQRFKDWKEGGENTLDLINEASSWMPARSEELSRAMGFAMGHRLGKQFMGLEGEQLYQFAARFVDNTHFRYAASDRPQIFRGALGSAAGLFKSWMIHYMGNMGRYAGAAWQRGQLGPILWSQAGTLPVAGMAGSAIMPVAEGFNSMASEQPIMQNIYEGMGWDDGIPGTGSPADVMMHGLPAFLNLSLSQRASVPGSNPLGEIEQLYSIMHWDRLVGMSDAVSEGFDRFATTGQHPVKGQATRDALYRALLPATMQDIMANIGQRGTRSLNTQNKLLSETTWAEKTINAMGFTPNRLERAYEQMDIGFSRREEARDNIDSLGAAYAEAEKAGDYREMRNILMRAEELPGVSADSVMRSSDTRLQKQEDGLLERQFNEQRDRAVKEAMKVGQ